MINQTHKSTITPMNLWKVDNLKKWANKKITVIVPEYASFYALLTTGNTKGYFCQINILSLVNSFDDLTVFVTIL